MRFLLICGFATVLAAAKADPVKETLDRGVEFFDERLKSDPLDFIAANQLVDRLSRRFRWMGRLEDLRRADAAAELSLKAVPKKMNTGGIAAKAQVALAFHQFATAKDLAAQLAQLQPGKILPQQILGDALLELGDLDGASRAWEPIPETMRKSAGFEGRLARMAWLRGENAQAGKHLDHALELVSTESSASPETQIWCLVQRGEHAFKTGDWATAEKHYSEALRLAPTHWRTLEHLAELRGAQGKESEAAGLFEKAATSSGRPEIWQSLGDLHIFYKRPDAAKDSYARALKGYQDSIDRGEVLYIHHLAGFYTDSQENAAEAVKWARKDLEIRQTPHAWDALAWALYRQQEFPEAVQWAKKVVASGINDFHLLQHAAMIHMSAGEVAEGQKLLRRCAEANPHFNAFHVHR